MVAQGYALTTCEVRRHVKGRVRIHRTRFGNYVTWLHDKNDLIDAWYLHNDRRWYRNTPFTHRHKQTSAFPTLEEARAAFEKELQELEAAEALKVIEELEIIEGPSNEESE
jgi:hypothetical protein